MNPLLGDKEVRIGGATYVARPDFRALSAIEAGDRSLSEILDRIATRRWKLTDVVLVLHSCIVSGTSDASKVPTFEELGRAIQAQGFSNFASVVATLVSELWQSGSSVIEKKAESEPTSKS